MGLDTVELVLAVEAEFDIEIPNDVAMRLISVGDMHDFIVEALCSRGEAVDEDRISEILRDLVVRQLGVRPGEVIRTAQFVRDLKAD